MRIHNSPNILYFFSLFAVTAAITLSPAAVEAGNEIMQNDDIAVVYDPPLQAAAGEVLRLYPVLRRELQDSLRWHLNSRPRVVLIRTNQQFREITRNSPIVAFASPPKDLIVIDYSRMSTRPFNLRTTLKHEMCHLLLHEHIKAAKLPRWLDEGVCQWASDGIGELLMDKSWSGLDAAVMSGQTFRFSRLANRFPSDKSALMLAYEQSKSLVVHIDRQYGLDALLDILGDLKNGETIEAAIFQNLSLSLQQLEKEWLAEMESTPRWLLFLANNIYAILFFFAAVLLVVGFIRAVMRRRKYARDEEEEEDEKW
ncbi:MAG: hypothetical protein JRF38_12635 [Deltaproteobacteria bacterium]|jgi:hypothetical protein|nr:hypothetical protein [Deltaproteobacteria bacterium]